MTNPSGTLDFNPTMARRVAVAGAIGTVLEWYDYGLYGTASALVITPVFFSGLDPVTGQLVAFGTFAVGFLARPLGGIILGNLGDRFGRKSLLMLTILLMGITTTLIGLLPPYATIGIAAPLILVFLRLVQGFGAGAELAGALTYVSESTVRGRRAFLTSFSSAASVAGTFLSTGIFAIVAAVTTHEQLLSWGWRIPFLLSIVLVVVGLVIRSRLTDSPEFRQLERLTEQNAELAKVRKRIPLFDMLRNDPRSFFSVLLAPTGLSVVAYITFVFGVGYIVNTLGMPTELSLVVILTSTGVGVICCPLFGKLADRIGSAKVFIGGAVFGLLFAFPFFALLNTKNVVLILIAAAANLGIAWGATAGAQGEFMPSLFKTRYRYTGVGTARELNSAIFAGPAPLIAAALLNASGSQPWPVAILVVISMALTIIGVAIGRPVTDDDIGELDGRESKIRRP